MNYKPLSEIPARPPSSLAGGEEGIVKKIVNAAFTVHKKLGPGLLVPKGIASLEKVYEICFCHELSNRGLKYQRQVDVPIVYDGIVFNEGLRLDVLVEELVICELLLGVPSGKDVDGIHPVKYFNHLRQKSLLLTLFHRVNPVWVAQILSYLKLTDKRLGFLININVSLIKNGIIPKGSLWEKDYFIIFVSL